MRSIKTLLLLASLFVLNTAFAQGESNYAPKNITVEDINKAMSKGERPGLKVNIYQATKADVEKAWTKAIKEGKVDVQNVANEIFVMGTALENISATPVNIYSMLNEYEDNIELVAFFEVDSVPLTQSDNEPAYLAAKKFVREFAVTSYKEAVEKEVAREESKLKEMEKDLKKLINENEKYHKKISKEERDIQKNENEIKTNELDQDRVRGFIQKQKDQVYKAKDEVQKEAAEKVLKDYEKDLAKLIKDKERMHKSIDKSEKDIRDYQRSIEDGKMEIQRKQSEVDKQEQHFQKTKKKLESIA